MEGCNIIDLVNEVVRQRKGSEPAGWQPFAGGLKQWIFPKVWLAIGSGGIGCIDLHISVLELPKDLSFLLQIKNGFRQFEKEQVASPYPKTNDQLQENSKANCFYRLQYLSRNNKSKNFIPHIFYLQRKSIHTKNCSRLNSGSNMIILRSKWSCWVCWRTSVVPACKKSVEKS